MKKLFSTILNFISKLLKVDEKKILFETGRDLVDGTPRAIYSYIKNNCPNDFKTVWLVTRKTDVSNIKPGEYAYYKTLKSLYFIATSKYWIRSESLGNIIKKKKNQVYIQAWHGHGALKKMGYDVHNDTNRPPVEHVKDWDYFISSDPLDEQVIISSTGYNKKTVMLGAACTDEILKLSKDTDKINMIKQKLGIAEKDFNKKIIFYAPTFRDSDLNKKNLQLPISCLSKIKDTIILIRLHPLIKELIDDSIFKDNIINACTYPDASEILAIADVLISDYSSIIYEYAVLNRPIIFYDYDLELYLKERGLYLDPQKDLPGPVIYDEEALYLALQNTESLMDEYKNKLEEFNKKYNYLNDGQVSKRFVQKLKEGYFK